MYVIKRYVKQNKYAYRIDQVNTEDCLQITNIENQKNKKPTDEVCTHIYSSCL